MHFHAYDEMCPLIIAFPNYTAQNLGAGKPERVRAGFFAGLRLVWRLYLPLTALYWLAAPALVGVFLKSATGLALESGVSFLRIVAPFYLAGGALSDICCLQISRFTVSKPSNSAIASVEKFTRQLTTLIARYFLKELPHNRVVR